ncbi:MAG: hypothetical protein JW816_03700 [Candidatus Buchananbacteria bacterium]|nr:hypothetical protein [Candidatus Buchananbacteria bacterium]
MTAIAQLAQIPQPNWSFVQGKTNKRQGARIMGKSLPHSWKGVGKLLSSLMPKKTSRAPNEEGRLIASLSVLFSLIRDVWAKMEISPAIIDWLSADGKQFLLDALAKLGEEFLDSLKFQTISDSSSAIMVNLDAPPKNLTHDLQPNKPRGLGWQRLELQGDQLFLKGREVVMHKVQHQDKIFFIGVAIKSMKGLAGCPYNLSDALARFPHLIPYDVTEEGCQTIFFPGEKYKQKPEGWPKTSERIACLVREGRDSPWTKKYICVMSPLPRNARFAMFEKRRK